MYQLVNLNDNESTSLTFGINENDSLKLEAIKAVYLSKKDSLKFLSLDTKGNPVIFKVYIGEFGEDHKIKMLMEADEEDSYGIVELNSNELMSRIKENDLMELYIVKEAVTEEFLDRMQAGDENELELIDLIKGFFGYRNLVLPLYMVEIL